MGRINAGTLTSGGRRFVVVTLVLALLGLVAIACEKKTGADAVRDFAAKDMPCPKDELVVTSVSGAEPGNGGGEIWRANGCDRVKEYWVRGSEVKAHSGESWPR